MAKSMANLIEGLHVTMKDFFIMFEALSITLVKG